MRIKETGKGAEKERKIDMKFDCSVTSKKLPNVYKSCPKLIPLEKGKILTPLKKLPKMCAMWANCCHRLRKDAQS